MTSAHPVDQIVMYQNATKRISSICKTFMEMQNSGNPLTPEEIRGLIRKRPHIYGVLEAWAAPEAPSKVSG